jgi:hypothetical protein
MIELDWKLKLPKWKLRVVDCCWERLKWMFVGIESLMYRLKIVMLAVSLIKIHTQTIIMNDTVVNFFVRLRHLKTSHEFISKLIRFAQIDERIALILIGFIG